MFAYVGSRTTKERNATGKGISVYEVHGHDWKLIQVVGDLVNPSFQCFDETGNFLYSVHGDFSEISAFKRDRKTGRLTYLHTASTEGKNPVHLSMDRCNKWIYVANLATGTVSVIERREDGTVGSCVNQYVLPGKEKDYFLIPIRSFKIRPGNICLFHARVGNMALDRLTFSRSTTTAR